VSDGLSAAALADTARFWTERTGEHVSDEDAREAICNVAAFVDLLARWDANTVSSAAPEPADRGAER